METFVRGIHRSPVISQHKGQWRRALMFSLICVWINGWVNNREAGDLRRYRGHRDVIVMLNQLWVYGMDKWELGGVIYHPCSHFNGGLVKLSFKFGLRLIITTHINMMTSSNGNIFRVTGPLCGEFTGPGEFPTQRPVARSFDVFFDLRRNKRLNKQPWGWWFETQSWSLWRHCNDLSYML